jgi:hypothetical protein
MASRTFPTKAEPAAATNSDGFSCFLSNKTIGQIDDYHINPPGV